MNVSNKRKNLNTSQEHVEGTDISDKSQTADSLKAYAVSECHENHGFICWAENAKQAKQLGIGCEETYDAEYIDLRCRRVPEADELYHGKVKCAWDTEEGQRVYWKLGWWLEDSSCCEGCYYCWEYDKVPESKLNEDGLCASCAANEQDQRQERR